MKEKVPLKAKVQALDVTARFHVLQLEVVSNLRLEISSYLKCFSA